MKRLASVNELNSGSFRAFMAWINSFARVHGLRVHANGSKTWEYPWSWQNLHNLSFPRLDVLAISSELCPMPWFISSLGAEVTLVEIDPIHVPKWIDLKERNDFPVAWRLISGPSLPFESDTFDVVTSYSALEHVGDNESALNEVVRVLRPGGLLCLTFDICEPLCGMKYPACKGTALNMATFDRLVWHREDLEPLDPTANWNREDIESFLEWQRKISPQNNYIVGGAVLRKRATGRTIVRRPRCRSVRVHQLDTGLGSGNTGDDAMFIAAHSQLPPEFELTTEVHSVERSNVWPRSVRYLSVTDEQAIERSIRAADIILLMGDTPVMDEWGLEWPLRANDRKLQLCHQLGKPVHAVGVGVDRLQNPEGLQLFQKSYPQLASWSVRSVQCKCALEEMGVASDKIVVGADWAWLLHPQIDSQWAEECLQNLGAAKGGVRLGVNVVNEMWRDRHELKSAWASMLDRLIEKHDAQVFFFCNESRAGGYFDRAAAEEVQLKMRHPSFLLADRYYTPDEAISLVSKMHVTLSQRYHFTLFSVLADVYPVSVERGQKMRALNQELELPFVGDMEQIDEDRIQTEVEKTLEDAEAKLRPLRLCRQRLKNRAHNNLSLLRNSLSEYKSS
jgi:polysaccharide pyruvyl transferase WcaK-like protein/SAM-dependent methyltransferase